MYSERDRAELGRTIRRCALQMAAALAALLALAVVGYARRLLWLALGAMALFAVTVCFGAIFRLSPCLRYRRFLTDMENGLSREMTGRVVAVADADELQDGARVLPVRIFVDQAQDERVVYLNVSKRALFPAEGTRVRLKLYGRHIREVAPG